MKAVQRGGTEEYLLEEVASVDDEELDEDPFLVQLLKQNHVFCRETVVAHRAMAL
jgi:hypothetical protein